MSVLTTLETPVCPVEWTPLSDLKARDTSPVEWIEAKKQGKTHPREEILQLVKAVLEGRMSDYQLSAWLMAVCLKGLTFEETTALTEAFVRSGHVLEWTSLNAPTVDKHSTGGVGDKTTLIVLALLGVVGIKAPKLSGRGLGYTGGTIDKIEAIPGFQSALSDEQFQAQLRTVGIALSSQTPNLAPADGVFYALRDVTATVDNLSLIAASVVSKKIASGADAIVLDIKVGAGAFMKTLEEATALAELCQQVGQQFGRRIETILTNMDAPLGMAVGHSLEIEEVIHTLKGQGEAGLTHVSLLLAAAGMVAVDKASTLQEAYQQLQATLHNGEALKQLGLLIEAQGGEVAVLETPQQVLPQASRMMLIPAPTSGRITRIDALAIAKATKTLGGGRTLKTDALDLSVGVVLKHQLGDVVNEGATLAVIHGNKRHLEEAKQWVLQAFELSPEAEAFTPPPLVLYSSLGSVLPHRE